MDEACSQPLAVSPFLISNKSLASDTKIFSREKRHCAMSFYDGNVGLVKRLVDTVQRQPKFVEIENEAEVIELKSAFISKFPSLGK